MFFADRVLETTATTGTADFVLSGATAGYQAFATAFADGDIVRYAVSEPGGDWEVGEGIFSVGGNSVSRLVIYSSSNGGLIVTFGAGVKDIWCDISAVMLAQVPGQADNTVLIKDTSGFISGAIDVKAGTAFLSISDGAASPVAATGQIRIPEEPPGGAGAVIVGLAAGLDYIGLAYSAAGAFWSFGNSSQFAYIFSYSCQILGYSNGVSFYDGRNGITTDSAVVSEYLLADKTTTSITGSLTNFTFNVNAGEIWTVLLDGDTGCSGTGGVGFGLDCPAGTAITGAVFGAGTASNVLNSEAMTAINTAYGATSAIASTTGSTPRWAGMRATLVIGANPGPVTVRLYSRTNTQTSRLFARSKFEARRAVGV